MSKTTFTSTILAFAVKPTMILAAAAFIGRAAWSSGLDPQFVESAADSLAGLTGLPQGDCIGLVIAVLAFAGYQAARAFIAIVSVPRC